MSLIQRLVEKDPATLRPGDTSISYLRRMAGRRRQPFPTMIQQLTAEVLALRADVDRLTAEVASLRSEK